MARIPSSFDEFVASSAARLLRTAYLITGDQGEAEDLVQECLLQVQRRWRRVSAMDQPLAYARRILVRLAVRGAQQRERRHVELGSNIVETATASVALDLVGVRDEVRAALRQLTPRQRAMLVLRYFHDLSEAQIARALGCSIGTVKSTTSRSLSQLRELIPHEPLQTRSEKR